MNETALPPEPDVSYIVAAFDAAPFVAAAIDSALAQEGVSVEVIVADDQSRDDTVAIVEAICAREPRVRLVRMERNGGPSAARNAAIAVARGAWIAVLDADDLLLPRRTRRLLDLATTSGADVVADNIERFADETGAALSTLMLPGKLPYAFAVTPDEYLRRNLVVGGDGPNLGYLKPMLRREFVRRHTIGYDEAIRIGEDFAFCMDALLAGARYVVMSEVGYRYRVRAGSLSHRIDHAEIARLRAWHAGLAARADRPDTAEFRAAMDLYGAALDRAAGFTTFVDELKSRRIVRAATLAGRRADLWPLLLRHGTEALGKRLPRPGRPRSIRRTT